MIRFKDSEWRRPILVGFDVAKCFGVDILGVPSILVGGFFWFFLPHPCFRFGISALYCLYSAESRRAWDRVGFEGRRGIQTRWINHPVDDLHCENGTRFRCT